MTISPATSSEEERLTAIRAVAEAFDKSGVG
jgi:hypothetical protein